MNNTERLTIRLSLSEMQAIKKMATGLGISTSQLVRTLIKKSMNAESNLEMKLIIEILMILRHKTEDKEISEILLAVDQFKEIKGIE